jgi:hypothetical protein
MSIKTIKQTQTAYLARPGFPGLIEIQERQELNERPLFIDGILISLEDKLSGLLKHIGLETLVKSSVESTKLSLNGQWVQITDLF